MSDLFTPRPRWGTAGIRDRQRGIYTPSFKAGGGGTRPIDPPSDDIVFWIKTNSTVDNTVGFGPTIIDGSVSIDWGDGTVNPDPRPHTYTTIGEFRVVIKATGRLSGIVVLEFTGTAKLIGIESFGRVGLEQFIAGGQSANIQFLPTEIPASLTIIHAMLAGNSVVDATVMELWNWENIEVAVGLFQGASNIDFTLKDQTLKGQFNYLFGNATNCKLTIHNCTFTHPAGGAMMIAQSTDMTIDLDGVHFIPTQPTQFPPLIQMLINSSININKVVIDGFNGASQFISQCQNTHIRINSMTYRNIVNSPLFGLVINSTGGSCQVSNLKFENVRSIQNLFQANFGTEETPYKLRVSGMDTGIADNLSNLFSSCVYCDILVKNVTNSSNVKVDITNALGNVTSCKIELSNFLIGTTVQCWDFVYNPNDNSDANWVTSVVIDELHFGEGSYLGDFFEMSTGSVVIKKGVTIGDSSEVYQFVRGKIKFECPRISVENRCKIYNLLFDANVTIGELVVGNDCVLSHLVRYEEYLGQTVCQITDVEIGSGGEAYNLFVCITSWSAPGNEYAITIDTMRLKGTLLHSRGIIAGVSGVNRSIHIQTVHLDVIMGDSYTTLFEHQASASLILGTVYVADGVTINHITDGSYTDGPNLGTWIFGDRCKVTRALSNIFPASIPSPILANWKFGNGCEIAKVLTSVSGASNFEFGNDCIIGEFNSASYTHDDVPFVRTLTNFKFGKRCRIEKFHVPHSAASLSCDNFTFGDGCIIDNVFAHVVQDPGNALTNFTFGNNCTIGNLTNFVIGADDDYEFILRDWTFGDGATITHIADKSVVGSPEKAIPISNFTFGKNATVSLGYPNRCHLQLNNWSFGEGSDLTRLLKVEGGVASFLKVELSNWSFAQCNLNGMLSVTKELLHTAYTNNGNYIDLPSYAPTVLGIGTWDIGDTTKLHQFLKNNDWYNEDLSTWDVSHISIPPVEFNLNAVIETEHLPKWGE